MKAKVIFIYLLLFIFVNAWYSQETSKLIYQDDFSEQTTESREYQRGTWTVRDKILSSVWSEAATVKNAKGGSKSSHKVYWEAKFDNACIEMQVLAKDISNILIGLDGKGHVWYLIFTENSYKSIVFPTDKVKGWVKKTNKYETKDIPSIKAFKQNEWTDVKLTIKGNTFELKVGHYVTTVEDVGFGRHKTALGFNFTKGEVKIKNLKITEVK